MPLSMVEEGEPKTIVKVGGKEEVRKFLENLGFVDGTVVTVVSSLGGNMILKVKDSRVALGRDMASKFLVAYKNVFVRDGTDMNEVHTRNRFRRIAAERM